MKTGVFFFWVQDDFCKTNSYTGYKQTAHTAWCHQISIPTLIKKINEKWCSVIVKTWKAAIRGIAELKSKRNLLWTQKSFSNDQYFDNKFEVSQMRHKKLIDIFYLNLAVPQFSTYTMDLHKAACVSHLTGVGWESINFMMHWVTAFTCATDNTLRQTLFSAACECRHNTKLKAAH